MQKVVFYSLLIILTHASSSCDTSNSIKTNLTQVDPTTDDLVNAQNVATAFWDAMKNVTYYATGSSPNILSGVSQCITQNQYIAVLGYVITYEGYNASETENLIGQVANMTEYINSITQDMNWYFSHLTKYTGVQNQLCYNSMVYDQTIILNAMNQLNLYLNGTIPTSLAFQAACAKQACLQSTTRIVNALAGNYSLCNSFEILQTGYPQGGYFQCWIDQMNSKAGYLLALANLGITAQSAYITLTTQTPEVWQTVQADLVDTFNTAGGLFHTTSLYCTANWEAQADVNIPRIMTAVASKTATAGVYAEAAWGLAERWYPLRAWVSIWMSAVTDYTKFYYICYNCYGAIGLNYLNQKQPGYNGITTSLALNDKANNTILNQTSTWQSYADNGSLTAQQMAEQIFENYCVSGVLVVERYVGEVVVPYLPFFYQIAGGAYTVCIWAVDGFCKKNNPVIPPTQ